MRIPKKKPDTTIESDCARFAGGASLDSTVSSLCSVVVGWNKHAWEDLLSN
jgi:hypothetical protein